MIVCNSTVLIYLSKISRLNILRELFKEVLIPEEVKREVVEEGKKRNHIDVFDIEKSINEGWIQVRKVKVHRVLKDIEIDLGEAEAISLAIITKNGVLVDQNHARTAAKIVGISPHGTIHVLLQALENRIIGYDMYLLSLLDLIDIGFRMSQEVYIEAVRLGRELSKK